MDSLTRSIMMELLSFSTNQNQKLYMVGGTLRDRLSRKPCTDFDITGINAAEFGRSFSKHLNFTCVPLDNTPGRKTVRVILDQNQHLDFTDLQGRNIEEDLSQRDFTINAMGQLLSEFLAGRNNIIDPHNGQEDLQNKKIRVLPGPIFQSDPLRILRAFRFAATLGFEIDEETLIKISDHKSKSIEPAQERIWHELSLFFNARNTSSLLDLLHNSGVLNYFFPNGIETYPQISTHYQRLENLVQEPEKAFPDYATELRNTGFDNKGYLLKIAVLLFGENQSLTTESDDNPRPPLLSDIGWNLKTSNAEIKFTDQVLNGTRSLSDFYTQKSRDPGDVFELIHIHREEFLASVFLFFSGFHTEDSKVTHFCNFIFKFYFSQYQPVMCEKPLLNGEDIMRHFSISPSPLLGKILHCTQKAHVLGSVTTHVEAIAFANELIQSNLIESEQ
jgi:poly(A) polymerase